ncbi:hypothetical protein RvY_06255 [Ramazzottius varieornatus]|uniref:Uncharacterized protein n=1 Tax=Ramazzottius varieornatus TaxID=947166 RepID=A0A1D1UXW5_RAMVA|nr:hypothetical protein RvY_06255 [Ramazzottius varieornatus]
MCSAAMRWQVWWTSKTSWMWTHGTQRSDLRTVWRTAPSQHGPSRWMWTRRKRILWLVYHLCPSNYAWRPWRTLCSPWTSPLRALTCWTASKHQEPV